MIEQESNDRRTPELSHVFIYFASILAKWRQKSHQTDCYLIIDVRKWKGLMIFFLFTVKCFAADRPATDSNWSKYYLCHIRMLGELVFIQDFFWKVYYTSTKYVHFLCARNWNNLTCCKRGGKDTCVIIAKSLQAKLHPHTKRMRPVKFPMPF